MAFRSAIFTSLAPISTLALGYSLIVSRVTGRLGTAWGHITRPVPDSRAWRARTPARNMPGWSTGSFHRKNLRHGLRLQRTPGLYPVVKKRSRSFFPHGCRNDTSRTPSTRNYCSRPRVFYRVVQFATSDTGPARTRESTRRTYLAPPNRPTGFRSRRDVRSVHRTGVSDYHPQDFSEREANGSGLRASRCGCHDRKNSDGLSSRNESFGPAG